MDPLGTFTLAFSVINLGVVFGRSLHRAGPLDYAEWKNCVRLGKDKKFHGVWDIPLTGDGEWDSQTDELIGARDDNPPILPPQDADSIRLTIHEGRKDGLVASDNEDASGFTALTSQWRKDGRNPWYHIKTYETSSPARVHRYIRVFKGQNQTRQVEIECRTFVIPGLAAELGRKPPAHQFLLSTRLSMELEELDAHYRPIRADQNWKQTFLLQFHHACLCSFSSFLATLVLQDRTGRDGNIDPAWAELRRWNLKEITKYSYECRSLREMNQELVSTTESLIDVVKSSPTVAEDPQTAIKFMAIEADLRGYCREVKERLQKLSDGLEHDLKFMELARNVNQTRGVQQLTLLATIFLPLSLAAGVLSMQTRFKDLGNLLYDFFGVVMLLGAIVVIIFIVMTTIAVIKEAESRLTQYSFYREDVRHIVIKLLILGLFSYGSLILSSFLVGMFKDVALGAKVLGYGSAAAFGLVLLLLLPVLLMLSFFWISSRASPRPRKQKKKTSVDGPEGTVENIQLEVMAPPEHQSLEGIAIVGIETR
ncbi:hypothetical protein LCI18_003231 [Fusarium solani-melongenae]|uniref:Uncharacterized protein n=1 Tax=Fusarium solani subsp. cucurbitae TaxID=2747967 RepID=A0ACD3YTT3_FUSSC|nr:hypothetical protein LCI18_003231 [Fusarium solani-melongenae]